jgi:hypothetical protein
MPYITKSDQLSFQEFLNELHKTKIANAGQLNFLLTTVALKYMLDNSASGMNKSPILRYEQMNSVVGALDSAKEEFRRRVMNPYEEQKAFEASSQNADPYEVLS